MGARSRRTAVVTSKVASALSAEIISTYPPIAATRRNQAQVASVWHQEQLTAATVEGRIVELSWIGGNFVKFLCGTTRTLAFRQSCDRDR